MLYRKKIPIRYAVREARLITLLRRLERKDPETAKCLAERFSQLVEQIEREGESA